MADITISKKNESFLNIDCDLGILYEMKEYFTFEVPGAKFHPKVKAKVWDGKISLVDLRFGTIPAGLYDDLVSYATKLDYTIEYVNSPVYGAPNDKDSVTIEDVKNFILSLELSFYNKDLGGPDSLSVREYQIIAVYNCIKNHRQISVNPTGCLDASSEINTNISDEAWDAIIKYRESHV